MSPVGPPTLRRARAGREGLRGAGGSGGLPRPLAMAAGAAHPAGASGAPARCWRGAVRRGALPGESGQPRSPPCIMGAPTFFLFSLSCFLQRQSSIRPLCVWPCGPLWPWTCVSWVAVVSSHGPALAQLRAPPGPAQPCSTPLCRQCWVLPLFAWYPGHPSLLPLFTQLAVLAVSARSLCLLFAHSRLMAGTSPGCPLLSAWRLRVLPAC